MPNSLSQVDKRILSLAYCGSVMGSEVNEEILSENLELGVGEVNRVCDRLVQLGLLARRGDSYTLTERGRSSMKVVLVGGVFDIIHPGHIHFLKEAKAFGDVLLVSVARDKTVTKMKGREAFNKEKLRLQLVQSIKFVDLALLGSEKDILETVERTRPDMIVLGYDQAHDDREIEAGSARRGVNLRVMRLKSFVPGVKTSRVLASASKALKEI